VDTGTSLELDVDGTSLISPLGQSSPESNVLDRSMLIHKSSFAPPGSASPTPIFMSVDVAEAASNRFQWHTDSLDCSVATEVHVEPPVSECIPAGNLSDDAEGGKWLIDEWSPTASEMGRKEVASNCNSKLCLPPLPQFGSGVCSKSPDSQKGEGQDVEVRTSLSLDVSETAVGIEALSPWTPAWSFVDTPASTSAASFSQWPVPGLQASQDAEGAPKLCPALAGLKGLTPLNLQVLSIGGERDSSPAVPLSCFIGSNCTSTCTYSSSEFSRGDAGTPAFSPALAGDSLTAPPQTPAGCSPGTKSPMCEGKRLGMRQGPKASSVTVPAATPRVQGPKASSVAVPAATSRARARGAELARQLNKLAEIHAQTTDKSRRSAGNSAPSISNVVKDPRISDVGSPQAPDVLCIDSRPPQRPVRRSSLPSQRVVTQSVERRLSTASV